MHLNEIVEKLELVVYTGDEHLDCEIARGYVSDLMSDVIAHGEKGDIWITLQIHMNVVAVAAMKEVGAVILTGGRKPDDEVTEKAREQGVVLLGSEHFGFEIAGRIYSMGVPGV